MVMSRLFRKIPFSYMPGRNGRNFLTFDRANNGGTIAEVGKEFYYSSHTGATGEGYLLYPSYSDPVRVDFGWYRKCKEQSKGEVVELEIELEIDKSGRYWVYIPDDSKWEQEEVIIVNTESNEIGVIDLKYFKESKLISEDNNLKIKVDGKAIMWICIDQKNIYYPHGQSITIPWIKKKRYRRFSKIFYNIEINNLSKYMLSEMIKHGGLEPAWLFKFNTYDEPRVIVWKDQYYYYTEESGFLTGKFTNLKTAVESNIGYFFIEKLGHSFLIKESFDYNIVNFRSEGKIFEYHFEKADDENINYAIQQVLLKAKLSRQNSTSPEEAKIN